MAKLKAMGRGKSWDKHYIAYEVNYHREFCKSAGWVLDAGRTSRLKDLLRNQGLLFRSTSTSQNDPAKTGS